MIGKSGEIGRIETHGGAPANTSLDWPRIRHLLKLGVFASLAVLAGDMLLGWGVSDPSVTELPALRGISRYPTAGSSRPPCSGSSASRSSACAGSPFTG